MAETYDLLLKNGIVVNHDGVGERHIGVRDGKIANINASADAAGGQVIDCKGLHILPGVIDSQVHFREPGAEHKEDLETGSRAAVLGGVTAVFEMPNTSPLTTSAAAIEDKLTRAHHRMWCDHGFYMGATHDNAKDMAELERQRGVCGIKIFMGASTGDLLIADDAGVREVMRHGRRRIAIHSEDEDMLRANAGLAREGDWSSHPDVRSAEAALKCTERLLRLARETGRQVHVLHISTAEEVPLLAANKDIATAEITPQHLTLEGPEIYQRLKGFAQMNPPLRDRHHIDGLWQGLASGIFDVCGSDHAPHSREEKAKPYPASPSGMPGVQTIVPVMLTHVQDGRLSLERFVDLFCHGPNRIFQIAGKGRMAVGYDADFTIIDMKKTHTIRDEDMASKCGWTPFDGFTAKAWPKGTIIRGQQVMWEDELVGSAIGEPVRFLEIM